MTAPIREYRAYFEQYVEFTLDGLVEFLGGWTPDDLGGLGSGYGKPHKGNPGHRGGSLPRGSSEESQKMDNVVRTANISTKDMSAYERAMALNEDYAVAMLQKLGMTKEEALAEIEKARFEVRYLGSTKEQWVDENGKYVPERQRVHKRIIDSLLNQSESDFPEQAGQPVLLITGGYPGSGKSEIKNSSLFEKTKSYIQLDSDEIKEMLAMSDGYRTVGTRAAAYHEESTDILNEVMRRGLKGGQSIVLDSTMKSSEYILGMATAFHKNGYRVETVYTDLPIEKAMTRAMGRYLGGGRFVDPAYIATHDSKNMKTFEAMKPNVDHWWTYNTDVPRGQPPILVGEGGS
jgi:predicted ABC-type ATPase